MKERLTKKEFIERQAKRKAERKETRNFILGLIVLTTMSYASIWIASAIAMIH